MLAGMAGILKVVLAQDLLGQKDLYPFGNTTIDQVPLLPENLVRQMPSSEFFASAFLFENRGE